MKLKKIILGSLVILIITSACNQVLENSKDKIVGTGQTKFYDKDGNSIKEPSKGNSYYGQDAQYGGIAFSYTNNGDGTVTDNNTGLMWQQIPYEGMVSFSGADEYCADLELAGYTDWRVPSAKELFSLTNFEARNNLPCIDTAYFKFPPRQEHPQGRRPRGNAQQRDPQENMHARTGSPQNHPQGPPPQERPSLDNDSGRQMPPPPSEGNGVIGKDQGQFWTSNFYKAGTTHGGAETAFGVNHVTGHIKGYPTANDNRGRGKRVRAVRGNAYLINNFVDNGDGTISDLTTGLMWMKNDYGKTIMWKEALEYCENLEFAGHDDWHLPNVKELQSIIDYSGVYPAVNPKFFNSNKTEDSTYYTWLWTSTTAHGSEGGNGGSAWYVSFGKAVGLDGQDAHGAGAVRERPKYAENVSMEKGDNYVCSLRAVRYIDNH